MKLKSKKQKVLPIVLIALAVVILAAIIVGVVLLIKNNQSSNEEEDQVNITLSMSPQTKYYVGDSFDPTGTEIQVNTGDMETTYFVKYPNEDMKFTGFDSSKAGEIMVTVHYKEYSTSFKVTISEYPTNTQPTLVSIRLSEEMQTSLRLWRLYGPIFDNMKLICTHSDGSEVEIPMSSNYCSGVDRTITSAGTTQFTVRYTNDRGETAETVVTVTITE